MPVVRRSASRAARTVELIVMSPSDMVPALANRSISGYVVADPFNAMAQVRKIGRIHTFLGDVWRDHACCVVLAHDDLIEHRAQALTLGIEDYRMMPGLNDSPRFIALLAELVRSRITQPSPSLT